MISKLFSRIFLLFCIFFTSAVLAENKSYDLDRSLENEKKYSISFAANDRSKTGHAFVIWHAPNAQGTQTVQGSLGFTPSVDGSEFDAVVGNYVGMTFDELKLKTQIDVIVRTSVDRDAFNAAMKVIKSYESGKVYALTRQDCTTLVESVADTIGLRTPQRWLNPYPTQFVDALGKENTPRFPPRISDELSEKQASIEILGRRSEKIDSYIGYKTKLYDERVRIIEVLNRIIEPSAVTEISQQELTRLISRALEGLSKYLPVESLLRYEKIQAVIAKISNNEEILQSDIDTIFRVDDLRKLEEENAQTLFEIKAEKERLQNIVDVRIPELSKEIFSLKGRLSPALDESLDLLKSKIAQCSAFKQTNGVNTTTQCRKQPWEICTTTSCPPKAENCTPTTTCTKGVYCFCKPRFYCEGKAPIRGCCASDVVGQETSYPLSECEK